MVCWDGETVQDVVHYIYLEPSFIKPCFIYEPCLLCIRCHHNTRKIATDEAAVLTSRAQVVTGKESRI
jgi:hypothetical protein